MSEFAPRPPSMKDLSHREGLIIVAAVSALLIGLVILRFGCNVAIDVCILRDLDAVQRTFRDFWNCLCPFCRIQVIDENEEEEQQRETLADVNTLLLRVTAQEKSLLIGSILTSKVVTEADLAAWNDTKSTVDCEHPEDCDKEATLDTVSVTSEGLMCSICLHDFELGQHISETKACGHVFHGDCIKQWLGSSHNHATCCPYCRANIITEADVKQMLHGPTIPNGV